MSIFWFTVLTNFAKF